MIHFAVIDLGSNSVRFQVTQVGNNGELNVIQSQKAFVRLSENMGPEKLLKPEPIARTLKALNQFKTYYEKLPNVNLCAVATAAVRQAHNQADFLKRVKKEVGLDLKVITGRQEAYLDYLAVKNTLPLRRALIIDTGGASTELILVSHGIAKHWISLPFGSVLLAQDFHLTDKIAPQDLFAAETFILQQFEQLPWLFPQKGAPLPLIALGGSNRTLAKIHRRTLVPAKEDLPDIHGMHLPAKQIFAFVDKLLSRVRLQRALIRGLSKPRLDVIGAGL